MRTTPAFPIPVVTVKTDEPTEREIAADAQPSLWERIDPCSAVIWVLLVVWLLITVSIALQIEWSAVVQSIPALPALPTF